ncbi:hypothetical protein [Mycolicibacterium sp. HK-90]|uniref:hypothetical protein n=1 Tax=Mycolicibacterium sp. HK-90 TaxID=3056937 RepID=UPI002658020B|nr:hypothetical protein [Mycolicibacterium sp. HK-90]WKG03066.1 hypothetical protein QU592_28420 [Mycolicibacterium sp. HK-90]
MAETSRRPRAAGRRLRWDMDQAKAAASLELNTKLEWSEHEAQIIDRAATAADRSEAFGKLWKAELAGEARAGVLVKIAAEQRAQDRAVIDLISRVNPGLGTAKSDRHARAAQSRWDRSARA